MRRRRYLGCVGGGEGEDDDAVEGDGVVGGEHVVEHLAEEGGAAEQGGELVLVVELHQQLGHPLQPQSHRVHAQVTN